MHARTFILSLGLAGALWTAQACGGTSVDIGRGKPGPEGSHGSVRDASAEALGQHVSVEGGQALDGSPATRADGGPSCLTDFPLFDRSCSDNQDCELVLHQTDCCGSQEILAIRRTDEQRFNGLESACRSGLSPCGCLSLFDGTLDDGTKVANLNAALAACVQGECRRQSDPNVFACGPIACGLGQACEAVVSDAGEPTYRCVTKPECSASCSSNPCLGPNCSCDDSRGHVLFSCPTVSSSAASCGDESNAGRLVISGAFAVAAADTSCATDDDCVEVSGAGVCTNACLQGAVPASAAKAIQSALDAVAAGVCGDFGSRGCRNIQTPCVGSPPGAACVYGLCVDFPPQKWSSFLLERRSNFSSFESAPLACVAEDDCTFWKVTPDGTLEKTVKGVSSVTFLTSLDFAALEGLLRTVELRRLFADDRLTCDADPTGSGPRVVIFIENQIGSIGTDVTDCALGAPPGNVVKRIYDLLSAY